jgi:hypothetical protein
VANASSTSDVVTAVCTGFVLVISLVAWELLMKPGYYGRRRKRSPPEEETKEQPVGKPSPPRSR